MLIPIRDDKRSYLIDSSKVICIRTGEVYDDITSELNKTDTYVSTIEVICDRDLIITLKYKDVKTRSMVFDSLFKTLDAGTDMFNDMCIGGAFYVD